VKGGRLFPAARSLREPIKPLSFFSAGRSGLKSTGKTFIALIAMNKAIEFLKGKKTYYCAAVGVLYIGGACLGFYDLDEKVLGIFGLGSLAFLRSAIHGHAKTLDELREQSHQAE
jgi:hypothetical protein